MHLMKEELKGLQEKLLKEMVNEVMLSSFLFIVCIFNHYSCLNSELLKIAISSPIYKK